VTLSGRPLLDTRPDSELFVDRVEEMSRVRAALNHGLNCLVVGERGSGKTSFMRALMFQSRQAGDQPGDQQDGDQQDGDQQDRRPPELVYVHGAGTEGAGDLLARVADALARHQVTCLLKRRESWGMGRPAMPPS